MLFTVLKSKNLSVTFSWTPTHGHTSVGQPAKTYVHQLCVDNRYSLDNLPRAMADWDGWRVSAREPRESVLSACLNGDDNNDDRDEFLHRNRNNGRLAFFFLTEDMKTINYWEKSVLFVALEGGANPIPP